MLFKLNIYIISLSFFLTGCSLANEKKSSSNKENNTVRVQKKIINTQSTQEENKKKKNKIGSTGSDIVLNDKNAIPFFFNYEKNNPEDKVRISTRFGNIDIKLFKNTPYHRANFIYLTKKGYFKNTTFHRVVPNFIIQGGNSDRYETAKKRGEIGKYLLPPDTKKAYKHHRGAVSMPSSEIQNPYKLASPYEFFIVQQNPGAYHLDGNYTIFGKVISGMDVVDKINKQKTDNRETPLTNVFMDIEIIE
ncbi:MAG: peptidylprolyl isomerase [Flavobacteriaceae bacterium]